MTARPDVERANSFLAPERDGVVIRKWYPLSNQSGSVVGFISAEEPCARITHKLKLMRGPNGKYWIALPSEQQRNKDGTPRLDPAGKPVWTAIIEFSNRAAADRFTGQVLAAMRRQFPEVFDGEASR